MVQQGAGGLTPMACPQSVHASLTIGRHVACGGGARNPRQAGGLLEPDALALEPQHLHPLLNPRMGVLVAPAPPGLKGFCRERHLSSLVHPWLLPPPPN